MTTSAYAEVLQLVERLPLEEQQQLLAELAARVHLPSSHTIVFASSAAWAKRSGTAWTRRCMSTRNATHGTGETAPLGGHRPKHLAADLL